MLSYLFFSLSFLLSLLLNFRREGWWSEYGEKLAVLVKSLTKIPQGRRVRLPAVYAYDSLSKI